MLKYKILNLICDCIKNKEKKDNLLDKILEMLCKSYNEEKEKFLNEIYKYNSLDYVQNINTKLAKKKFLCFKDLTSETIAFILRLSQTELTYDEHLIIIYSLDKEILQKFLPGIMSYNLSLLLSSNVKKTLSIINYLLVCKLHISDVGKDILYKALINVDRSDLKATSWLCKDLFDDSKLMFFLQNLVLGDCTLDTEEYILLQKQIVFKLKKVNFLTVNERETLFMVINKMATKKILDVTVDFWETMKNLYYSKYNVEYVIELIQMNYTVCSPILELMPINEHSLSIISKSNKIKELKIFIRRIKKPIMEYEILKLYLEKIEIRNEIEIKYNIKELAIKFRNEISEHLFLELEKVYKKTKKSILFENCIESLKKDVNFDNHVNDIIISCHKLNEIDKNADLKLINDLCLKFLDKIRDETVAYNIFKLFKVEENLTNEDLFYIFDKILYFDLDSSHIRKIKYGVISKIFSYLIKNSKQNNPGKIINQKENKFFLPMLVKLWDEISIIPDEFEIEAVINLLKISIEKSGAFYQKRFFASEIYTYFLKRFTQEKFVTSDLSKYLSFFNFLESVVNCFLLPKENFENIFIYLCNLSCFLEARKVVYKMTVLDSYLAFYILYIQKKVTLPKEFSEKNLKTIKSVSFQQKQQQ